MNRLKLLLIADDRDDAASIVQAHSLAADLDAKRVEINLVRLSTLRGRVIDGDPIATTSIRVAAHWWFDPRAFRRLRKLIATWQPDIVHTWGDVADEYGRLAAVSLGAQPQGVTLLVSTPAALDFDYDSTLRSLTRRALARRTRRIVLASDDERQLAAAQGWPAERLEVIPPYIPPLAPSATDRAEVFARLRIPADARLIGLFAPLEPRSRIKEAIWSFDLLRSVRPKMHLVVIGRGSQLRELERFRDQQECDDAIHFVVDPNGADEIVPHADLLWSFDAAPRPSFATLGAVASGVPIVATDTAAHRWFVRSGETGLIVPVGVRPAPVQATLELMENETLRRRMAEAARTRMAADFGREAFVAAYRALYDSFPPR